MQYLDPLYGRFEISDETLKLFQTKALTRIRDISLSAVPPLATPSGMIGSRFEHSVGVSYLAEKLIAKKEFAEIGKNLYVAALMHDVGSPPFSHITERLMEDLTGKDHEEFAEKILFANDTKKAVENFGADIDIVYKMITGNYKPWSDLLNGSIDLDNIDNSLRWGMAIGAIENKAYDPEDLLEAYCWKDGKLALKLNYYSEIQKWELTRRLVYDVVYSDLNLIPETMLFRGLQFAYENGDLTEDFFDLTDSQALYVLEHRFNEKTQKLIRDMRRWFIYVPAGKITVDDNPSETIRTFCTDWKQRQKIADIIAESIGIEREFVTVYAGKDKGFKKIHLPFIGGEKVIEHQPLQKLFWRIKVFIHPKYEDKVTQVEEILEGILGE